MNKRVLKINKKKIKIRKIWIRNPNTQIVPNKKKEIEEDIYYDRDEESLEEFERGFHD
jgi:hypothetical protein